VPNVVLLVKHALEGLMNEVQIKCWRHQLSSEHACGPDFNFVLLKVGGWFAGYKNFFLPD